MQLFTHLTLLLVFCTLNVFCEENSSKQARHYDPYNDRTLPLALLLNENDYRRNQYDNSLADLLNQENGAQFRQNIFGLSNINNAVNPFANLFNSLPRPFIRNPDSPALTNAWQPCQDSNGQSGTCLPSLVCAKFGGTPSGSCGLANVCCVNSVSGCGGQVTLNNTYWRSPSTFRSGSTCGLTVTLDNNLIEQKNKICQVRLDFISFSTAQPNAQSVCDVDTFRVGGATNNVPIICGENDGQHMYINLPSPVSQLQLLFNFGSSSVTRSWNIKISMLPCGASFLAPKDCLQYFTQTSGDVKSFNWKDVAGTTTRQLANQDYRICFRRGLVNDAAANRLCITPCTVTAATTAFSLSLSAAANQAQGGTFGDCNNDYIVLEDGFDPAVAAGTANVRDRFCGERLNVAAAGASSATVCSTVKPFTIVFRTNGDETNTDKKDAAVAGAAPTNGNLGFCLSFSQRSL